MGALAPKKKIELAIFLILGHMNPAVILIFLQDPL